eukprot:m51a1_g8388 putative srsf protein kinase 1 (645) ;mRNA; f:205355-207890
MSSSRSSSRSSSYTASSASSASSSSGASGAEEDEDYSSTDDEGTAGYRKGGYHPVAVGEVYNDRYRIVSKVGWGHFSTVWRATDLKTGKDVALKIVKSAPHYTEAAEDEIEILRTITKGDARNESCCAHLLDSFHHTGPNGTHVCMVFELLGSNLLDLIKLRDYRGIPVDIVKTISRQVLVGLNYMHTKCCLIHTDLKPENVLLYHRVDSGAYEFMRRRKAHKKAPPQPQSQQQQPQPQQQQQAGDAAGAAAAGALTLAQKAAAGIPLTKNQKKNMKRKLREAKKLTDAQPQDPEQQQQQPAQDPEQQQQQQAVKAEVVAVQPSGGSGPGTPEHIRVPGLALAERQTASPTSCLLSISSGPPSASQTPSASSSPVPIDVVATPRGCVAACAAPAAPEAPKEGGDQQQQQQQQEAQVTSNPAPSEVPVAQTAVDAPSTATPGAVDMSLFRVKIADFGNANWTHKHFTDDIQTRQYRSPEVIVGAKWGSPVDMWSMACLVFELLTGDFLFEPKSGNGYEKEDDHLAQMIELLGKPPRSVSMLGRRSLDFFNRRGMLRNITQSDLHEWTLKPLLEEKYKFSSQEAQEISDFLLPMLVYLPEKRATAKQMLEHPWLAGVALDPVASNSNPSSPKDPAEPQGESPAPDQ